MNRMLMKTWAFIVSLPVVNPIYSIFNPVCVCAREARFSKKLKLQVRPQHAHICI